MTPSLSLALRAVPFSSPGLLGSARAAESRARPPPTDRTARRRTAPGTRELAREALAALSAAAGGGCPALDLPGLPYLPPTDPDGPALPWDPHPYAPSHGRLTAAPRAAARLRDAYHCILCGNLWHGDAQPPPRIGMPLLRTGASANSRARLIVISLRLESHRAPPRRRQRGACTTSPFLSERDAPSLGGQHQGTGQEARREV